MCSPTPIEWRRKAKESSVTVGQGIGGDIKLLHKQYSGTEQSTDAAVPETLITSPSAHSFVDLESLSSSYSIQKIGLASMTSAFLSLRLSKAAQLSNWERPTLTPEQVSYAALDSLVSLKLAQRLERVKSEMQSVARGWVEREKRRKAEVSEARVWRWLTGKGPTEKKKDDSGSSSDTPSEQDESSEKLSSEKQTSEKQTGASGKASEKSKPRQTKKQKLESAALRAAQPPVAAVPSKASRKSRPVSHGRKSKAGHRRTGVAVGGDSPPSGYVSAVDLDAA